MGRFHVTQARSGEGAILTRFSHFDVSHLPDALPELFREEAVLLVGSDDAALAGEPGAEELQPGLLAFRGSRAADLLRRAPRLQQAGAIFALVDSVPDGDSLRRNVADPLRPWDHERLGARLYGQLGRRYAHRGLWLADDAHHRRWCEAAVGAVLAEAGHELPNGDVTLVMELPADSTFSATFRTRGRGDSFSIRRDFGERGFVREWRVERGEWVGEERRRPRTKGRGLAERLVQVVAAGAILVLTLPVAALAFLLVLLTRLTGVSSTARKAGAS